MAVLAGLTYNLLPFMVLPIYVALEKIDDHCWKLPHDLYGSRLPSFWKVTWPLSLPGVIAGTLLDLYSGCWRLHEVNCLAIRSQT